MFVGMTDLEGAALPRQSRLEIFVDGTNFEITSRPLMAGKTIDVQHLARQLTAVIPPTTPGHSLVALRYCTAQAPYMRKRDFEDRYFAYLRSTASVDLILGRHVVREADQRRPKRYEEKETDVNVAIHMVAGAYENRYDVAAVVTGDTDMVPAMKMVRHLGKRVVWVYLPSQADTVGLRKVSDAQYLVDEAFLRDCKHFTVIRG
jgi:uncharacterized LabA/DUF88 family protein